MSHPLLGAAAAVRRARVLPDWLRTPLRGLLLRLLRRGPLVDGWEDWDGVERDRPGPPAPSTPQLLPASAEPLRCLLVTGSLDVGGMDEVVAFLARRLPAAGVRTAVLHARTAVTDPAARPTGRLGRELAALGVEVVELAEAAAADWASRWCPDVVSAHGAPQWTVTLAQRLEVPYVETLHGMHTLFWVDWEEEARLGAGKHTIVAVSDLVRRQYLAGNPGYDPTRVVTVPNAVDDVRHARASRAEARARLGLGDEYLFVSLGRYCLQKNTYGLVAAFADVAQACPQAHLLVAGRPDDELYARRVRRLRDSLPCRDRVHLRDHAPDPAALLAAADGFVLDSFFEGWSLASMEALHAGVPVVLSDVGGAREQVGHDERRGYVVGNPLGDPLAVSWASVRAAQYLPQVNQAELVAALGRLVDERADRLHQRAALAAESTERFRPDRCVAEHAHVLRAAAADPVRAAGARA